jgi:DNA invertase Pin-like site-specific DNA recombinase
LVLLLRGCLWLCVPPAVKAASRLVAGLAARGSFDARGVAFISLRDNLDLSTPSGRLMFQIIGAMAEFERALIQERVKAGLRHARSKGKHLGRPTIVVDRSRIASLRAQERGWKAIAREMKLGIGTVLRAAEQVR